MIAMKKKILPIFIILINLFLFACTVGITIAFFAEPYEWNPGVAGFQCFKYFTIDSNLACGLGCLLFAVYYIISLVKGVEIPKWVHYVKLAVTSGITLTFLTCICFLGPVMGFGGLFGGKNFFLHLFNPILAFVSFSVLETQVLLKKSSLFGIIPTFLYSIAYVLCVVILRVWPDFYGFSFGGHFELVAVVLPIMYTVSWAIGFVLVIIRNAISHKR